MPVEAKKSSIMVVKKYLDPVPTAEMMEFWKSLSDAEREQFTAEASSLVG